MFNCLRRPDELSFAGGVFVVGVYTPDLLSEIDRPERIEAYAEWVAKEEARHVALMKKAGFMAAK